MTLEIKSIPVLRGKEAEEFRVKADAAFHNRPQTKPDKNRFDSLNKILRKAKMK